MLSEMLQTLFVQPLWIEQMHNRAQSGYSTEKPTQIQTAEWFLSSNYASADVHMCMCVIFFPNFPGAFSACSVYLFQSRCPVRLWVSLSLTCRQMNMWANMNKWIIHYSRKPWARLGYAGLSPSWPGSAWGSPQRCCEVKSGPLLLGHWTPQAESGGHSSRLREASSILFSPQFYRPLFSLFVFSL